ncbi:MAG TPA: excinuclease ABC subunit UvrA, partial [Methanocorpusculum sp.]|nr:excinuclease ABC subunit UvrA [Methanocorpusculum sp.]
KPDVDSIDGLSPSIAIEQKTTSKNPRSTVGTVTEIYDYLRLLFARIGIPYCPKHHVKIEARSPAQIADAIMHDFSGMVTVLAPVIRKKKGTYEQLFKELNADGFTRVRVDGQIYRTDDEIKLGRYIMHNIDIVIDRCDTADASRVNDAVEKALQHAEDGLVYVSAGEDTKDIVYSARMACPICGMSFEELQPRMFSFNSPFGACPTCNGLGFQMIFDPDLVIPDKTLAIADGAVATYKNFFDGFRVQYLKAVADYLGFTLMTPIQDLTEDQYKGLMYGTGEAKIHFQQSSRNADFSYHGTWEGLLPQVARLHAETKSDYRKAELEKFMRILPCPTCHGKRLKESVLAVKIADKSIADVTDLSIDEALVFFDTLKLSRKDEEIAHLILREIKSRLTFLQEVGLGYLTLSRSAGSLSGGEAQRIRLATQIGSNLMGVLYILDEPSIGLHQRDNQKLIATLKHLRDMGNTVIVVEHDEETIRAADHVIDIGPGAGIYGGNVTAAGTPQEIAGTPDSLTGKYLSGELTIPVPAARRSSDKYLTISGCRENNLKNVTASIPLGTLTVVTGVSGSGKSTLIYDTLYQALRVKVHHSKVTPGVYKSLVCDIDLENIIVIDQSPIGRTPRSNPATYT